MAARNPPQNSPAIIATLHAGNAIRIRSLASFEVDGMTSPRTYRVMTATTRRPAKRSTVRRVNHGDFCDIVTLLTAYGGRAETATHFEAIRFFARRSGAEVGCGSFESFEADLETAARASANA